MDINESLFRSTSSTPSSSNLNNYNQRTSQGSLNSNDRFSKAANERVSSFSGSPRSRSSMSREELKASLVYERMRALGVAGREVQKQAFAKIKELENKKNKNDLYKK